MPFQHVGWKEITEINPEITELLAQSIHVNILPYLSHGDLGHELGLKLVDSWGKGTIPLFISCMPEDGKMKVVIQSDDRIIAGEKIRGMLCQFQCALEELMSAHLMEGEQHRLWDINLEGAGENSDDPRR
jgi:hypothetical protein